MSGLPPLKGFKCAYMNKQFVNFKQCIREKFSATSTTFRNPSKFLRPVATKPNLFSCLIRLWKNIQVAHIKVEQNNH